MGVLCLSLTLDAQPPLQYLLKLQQLEPKLDILLEAGATSFGAGAFGTKYCPEGLPSPCPSLGNLGTYPIGGREVHEFLGTGVLVVVPPKLTTMELALIYNYNPDSGQTSKLSFKIFSV
jgi:hypothetical protein